MLIIKEEQIRVFETVRFPSFEVRMRKHIATHFNPVVTVLGDEGTKRLIHEGYEKGKKYGFITCYEVCLFTDIMILLGNGFDTDPQLPWVSDSLIYGNIYQPTVRIEMLYEKVTDFVNRVLDKDDVFPVTAFKKLSEYSLTNLDNLLNEHLEENMLSEFDRLWEHKFNNVDEYRLRMLINHGVRAAGKYGFVNEQGIGYYILLMFFLGHHFDIDPLYPWLNKFLISDELEEHEKVKLLQSTINQNVLSDIYGILTNQQAK